MKASELTIPASLLKFNEHPSITKEQTVMHIWQAISWLEVKCDEFMQMIPNSNIYAIKSCFSLRYVFDFTKDPFVVSINGLNSNGEDAYPFGGFPQEADNLPYLLQNCSYVEVNFIDIARRSSNIAIRVFIDEEAEDCNLLDWALEKYIHEEKIGGYMCRNTAWSRQ